ncbi:TetR/AcrR family transcriptional regulator [Mycobacterium sp. M1]|uniref:TetR/AcrR family transcriptional regulator n=1 Tax=Mycolicibacter acidiphilus TaxID=2835306 RepID=A0ABS5RKG0_9MYCO|nr:TetR/AcrR family transcriptional regulator [Mycolicibacter acidiphilus]MBS9534795.1 TetR/AcrR family transcriptional regulator [Mycolicibacter acidiphilus]
MTSPTGDPWRGRPAAERAADRRERLLAAALECMGTAGCGATSLRGVCRGAGVSLRYFYESFPDVPALLVAVYDRVADDLATAVFEALTSGDPAATREQRTRSAFRATVEFLDADPRRSRILFRETLASDALREHGAVSLSEFVAGVVAGLTGEPAQTAEAHPMQISALSGALVSLFLDRQAGTLSATKHELVDYCTALMTTVLST